MKKSANQVFLRAIVISICLVSIGSLSQSCNRGMDKKEAKQWFSNGEWLHDLQLKAHESTNQEEFEKQYKTNPAWWNLAFDWLKTNDLAAIEPGTYIIDEGNVRAIVSEAPAPSLDEVKWEAHHNFNDIQYIVKGQALMGVAPVSTAIVTEVYDPAKDVGFFEVEGAYFTAEPGTFFIFTPQEAHRPGIKAEGFESVKKIVIKVRASSEKN